MTRSPTPSMALQQKQERICEHTIEELTYDAICNHMKVHTLLSHQVSTNSRDLEALPQAIISWFLGRRLHCDDLLLPFKYAR
jgi:hypothetical protein